MNELGYLHIVNLEKTAITVFKHNKLEDRFKQLENIIDQSIVLVEDKHPQILKWLEKDIKDDIRMGIICKKVELEEMFPEMSSLAKLLEDNQLHYDWIYVFNFESNKYVLGIQLYELIGDYFVRTYSYNLGDWAVSDESSDIITKQHKVRVNLLKSESIIHLDRLSEFQITGENVYWLEKGIINALINRQTN